MKSFQSERDRKYKNNSSTRSFLWDIVRWVTCLHHALFLFNFVVDRCDCLVTKPRPRQKSKLSSARTALPASREELYPPLVLLGGIAQTKSSWDHHLGALAEHRQVLVYECIGQGEKAIDDNNLDASLPAQARRLLEQLDAEFTTGGRSNDDDNQLVVDIAGFSFGGRVAMAAACLQTDGVSQKIPDHARVRIRRLHLTGVGCDRSDYGHVAMRSFSELIKSDPSLRSFAWSILLATYSPAYLRGLPERTLERLVDFIASSNNADGLLAILDQAEVSDVEDPWHVVNMADRLVSSGETPEFSEGTGSKGAVTGKLCVGEFDRMAPVEGVALLQKKLGWIRHGVDVLPDCGHAVVLEQPRAWRESVLSFLNANGAVS
ncbi:unnamed protein product [Pseudo-nitzschia multistriata]|uniref:AB hydrolase-1 domain-containing protein n=1 Tax=Pseudo-nitzschia multistriata TaxID=183589 RepID=A0A448ZRN3_9STRA|nr:unnamed protein product [Pseudo-nitzschia multistriata]